MTSLQVFALYRRMTAEEIRKLLDGYSGPFYTAKTETQRQRIVEEAVKTFAPTTTEKK